MGLFCKLKLIIYFYGRRRIVEIPATKDDADIFIKTWSSIGHIISKMLKQNMNIIICTLDRFSRKYVKDNFFITLVSLIII